jgi:hypothetical protein
MEPGRDEGNLMTTTIHFNVTDMTSSCRNYIGERPTFDEAEHLARWHAARRGIRVEVDKVVQTAKRRDNEHMATITRDALGRIWTDLTWHGASFV